MLDSEKISDMELLRCSYCSHATLEVYRVNKELYAYCPNAKCRHRVEIHALAQKIERFGLSNREKLDKEQEYIEKIRKGLGTDEIRAQLQEAKE